MALAPFEAYDRARKIWGAHRVVTVALRPGGGADVKCLEVHKAGERHYAYHRLDENGHVACHEDCRKLEAAL